MKKLLTLLLLPVLASCGPSRPSGPSEIQWKGFQKCMADERLAVREYNQAVVEADAKVKAAGQIPQFKLEKRLDPLVKYQCANENGIDDELVGGF